MSDEIADVIAGTRTYIEKNGWWRGAMYGPNGRQACVYGGMARYLGLTSQTQLNSTRGPDWRRSHPPGDQALRASELSRTGTTTSSTGPRTSRTSWTSWPRPRSGNGPVSTLMLRDLQGAERRTGSADPR